MPQRTLATPIGVVRISARDGLLTSLRIGALPEPDEPSEAAVLDEAEQQLAAYFAGTRRVFNLPLAPAASDRGRTLRSAICGISHGETMSYGSLARLIGSGARAVGQACARNPLPIIVPCHRVVAVDGLGHYSGGDGPATKSWLLKHESKENRRG